MRVYKLEATVFDTYANNEDREKSGCIWLKLLREDGREEESLHLHMPYSTALEYASAINACNDREAAESIAPAHEHHWITSAQGETTCAGCGVHL